MCQVGSFGSPSEIEAIRVRALVDLDTRRIDDVIGHAVGE